MNDDIIKSLSVAVTLLVKLGYLDYEKAMIASKDGTFHYLISETYDQLLKEGKIDNA